ncbi:MAG: hypothetical protein CVV49_20030 [Spirochaetae bacterium HGW-Spirochaetae-5]|nr:MAG: hypothetical protein CVV49_20030 [Spirochaetae bacterium HGW-Spirochaetae-5]
MKKIRKETAAGMFDRVILNEITGSEIKSSEEFLSILNRYKREDGSLKSETRKYSIPEIEKKVKEISLPAISLYYMSDIYKNLNNRQLKESIAGDITSHASKKFNSPVIFTPAEKNEMTEHYILEKAIAESDTAINTTTTGLISKAQYELSRSDYNSNETDFAKMIQKLTEDMLSDRKFQDYSGFNENYISNVPLWRYYIQRQGIIEERNRALVDFVKAGGGDMENSARVKDVNTAENEIFTKAKSRLYHLLKNTTPGSGASGANPYYEIPDMNKLSVSIDEIDRYRKTLINNISGNENADFIKKLKSNNTGIAARGINRIDAQFKNEEMRIERLRKIKGDTVIYNEEMFKASRNHFNLIREELYRYAGLSADFIEALYSAGKTDPAKYIEFHKYRTERYIFYITFSEKLTADTAALSESGTVVMSSFYKGTIPAVLDSGRDLLKPAAIPAEVRGTLTREHLKDYAAVNADFRTKGSILLKSIRKNYDESIAGFSRAAALNKESIMNSEIQIGQDETDRLFNFAKKCSEAIENMRYTESALNSYKDEYSRISEELRKGNKPAGFSGADSVDSLLKVIKGFNSETIESETATRDILAKEGMASLSGSITLVQYYKRKGIPVKFSPTAEEIALMKQRFSRSPEVIVSSWKMNGKNFRQIDVNVTAELKKLMNKNAWNSDGRNLPPLILSVNEAALNIVFNPPSGWSKITDTENNRKISFTSPDMKGLIEITSISKEGQTLQDLVSSWPEKSGFSMIEKNWGKKDNSDYIRITSKNSYDGIMESYMIAKNGHVIILSGKTTGEMHRYMNIILSRMFRNLEVKG